MRNVPKGNPDGIGLQDRNYGVSRAGLNRSGLKKEGSTAIGDWRDTEVL